LTTPHETKQLIAEADRIVHEHGSISTQRLSELLDKSLDRINEIVNVLRQQERAYICYQGSVAMVYVMLDGDEEEE
jgi:hypothetical protein